MLLVTAGSANTSVIEQPCSDGVAFVDDVVIDISIEVTLEEVICIEKVGSYVSFVKTADLKRGAYRQPSFLNANIVLLCLNEGGRSSPANMVKDLQTKDRKRPILANTNLTRGAVSTQLVFYI